MSDLWILDHVDTGGGTRPPNWKYRKASLSDVLEWLGWEKCEYFCDEGEGWSCQFDETCEMDAPDSVTCEWVDCPNCLDGLVPPASQVEAAAKAVWERININRNWSEIAGSMAQENERQNVRAALIAAMEGVGDE